MEASLHGRQDQGHGGLDLGHEFGGNVQVDRHKSSNMCVRRGMIMWRSTGLLRC